MHVDDVGAFTRSFVLPFASLPYALGRVRMCSCVHACVYAHTSIRVYYLGVCAQKGAKESIFAMGTLKKRLRTNVINGVTHLEPADFSYRHSFEYRGSYLDIEVEKIKIRVRTWVSERGSE
eukprot:GHVU01069193.1.p2 GENE.GHVU01069193.1~~GHVU01069193.1.p2  ORF type:complete len:121 (-),score=3.00 GHVU01069193.1:1169-1531(-)